MPNDFTRCHGIDCHQRQHCAKHTAPVPEGDLTATESEELLLICGHALGPEPLSPAAQAVLTAITEISPAPADEIAAAALRAAADQAIPLTKTPWGTTLIPVLTSWESRDRLLAVADELEGQSQLTKGSN